MKNESDAGANEQRSEASRRTAKQAGGLAGCEAKRAGYKAGGRAGEERSLGVGLGDQRQLTS